ncbi:MAG: FadR/GntR family transcriptional regulator [Candidatus Bipolaricaulaceae bacterium]
MTEEHVLFKRVTPAKASASVADQIVAAINQGVFPVGSKLPSENVLAEQMGVSRPTVREALSALAAVGLIESRPGAGNFVRTPNESIARKALVLLENESSCLEIMEARGLLEPPVAALAAQKRTPQQVDRLEAICAELSRLAGAKQFDAYFDADKDFHLLLLRAAHNQLLATVLLPLINTMDQRLYREFTVDYYIKDYHRLSEVASLHGTILGAVADRAPARAAAGMRAHWQRMWSLVQDGEDCPALDWSM